METLDTRALLDRLEEAWDRGDGEAFAAPFAPDADFVNVRGELVAGPEIGPAHDRLFAGPYAGSTVRYRLVRTRPVTAGAVLAHVRGSLRVPAGPAAGSREALASLLLTAGPDGWRISAFHNTYVA